MNSHSVVSIGYERRSLDDFIQLLGEHGVSKLVDVREAPISRRPGFSKTRLSTELDRAGIEYRHHRPAGNPHRKDGDSVEHCLQLYRDYLRQNPDVLDLIGEELNDKPVAFLCYERCHDCCHRSVLLTSLEEVGYNLKVLRVE